MLKSVLGLMCFLLLASPVSAREVIDMAGRTVTVPDRIERVIGCVAPVSWMIYAVAPEKLAAFTSAPGTADWQILDQRLRDRPVIGSFLGGQGVNQETLLAMHPDVVIFWGWGKSPVVQRWVAQLELWHIPVVFVAMDRVEDYPRTFEFLGQLLGDAQRGTELADYGRCILEQVATQVATIPVSQRRRVYYAEGGDGLETEPGQSFHAQLIPLAGGINVHQGALKQRGGREKLSLEQVLAYQPDVILVAEPAFYRQVYDLAAWQQINAVKNRQVFLIPDHPLNWFDRPPSMMRFVGLQWLAKHLYPQQVSLDLVTATREFYRLFFHVELTTEQAVAILERPAQALAE